MTEKILRFIFIMIISWSSYWLGKYQSEKSVVLAPENETKDFSKENKILNKQLDECYRIMEARDQVSDEQIKDCRKSLIEKCPEILIRE